MAVILIDSYSESNYSDDNQVDGGGSGIANAECQTITTSTSLPLYSSKFYLAKIGSPTGNIVSKIYNISGTAGTNGIPSGTALATSDPISIATLTTGHQLIQFFFTGANAITLSASSHYGITVEYAGGDNSNALFVGMDDTSPTHSGNEASRVVSTWSSSTIDDNIFYLYGGTLTQTRTHTIDSLKRKQTIKVYTTDSLLRKKNTRTHTTDVLKKKRFTRAYTTDSYLLKRGNRTQTTDSLKRKKTLKMHTTDSLKRKRILKTHTTDTLKKKRAVKTYTTDSFIRKVYYKMYTTDSLLRKRITQARPLFADARQITPIGFK